MSVVPLMVSITMMRNAILERLETDKHRMRPSAAEFSDAD